MAAVAYDNPTASSARRPAPHDRREISSRPHLRLVPPPAPRRRRHSPGVYRRRRALAAVIVLAAAYALRLLLGGLGGGPLPASEPPFAPISHRVHLVEPGDTMWDLARALQPTGDIRPLVHELQRERDGRPLMPGELVELPAALHG